MDSRELRWKRRLESGRPRPFVYWINGLAALFMSIVGNLCFRTDAKRVSDQVRLLDAQASGLRKCDSWKTLYALLILAEDHRFYEHKGIDTWATCRAIVRYVSGYSVEGASTIEQQLVRVVLGRFERTLWRKFREVAIATAACRHIPKPDLASAYLICGYFGSGGSGISAACRTRGYELSSLSCAEAATLVAALKYPFSRERLGTLLTRRKMYLLTALGPCGTPDCDLCLVASPLET